MASEIPVRRLAAFITGVFSVWVAVVSPLGGLDHHLLTAHMAQHLLLMTVAAPLILLGAPAILAPFPRWPPAHASGRFLRRPLFCWLASTATVIGWHVPALFELGLHSEAWHGVEQASFFAAGLLFWLPVIQPMPSVAIRPPWHIPLYLFLAALPCDALSAFLAFCDRVVYPHYLSAHQTFDGSALRDQERAGALMWVWATFAYLVPAAIVTIRMLSPQRRASKAEVI